MDDAALVDGRPVASQALDALKASADLQRQSFTVQDGGVDPLFSLDASNLPNGTIVTVVDLGGCGANGTPGKGICLWMGEWRRLSRGVTATLPPGVSTLDAFKDPMRIAYSGSLATTTRAVLARPYLGAKWSFVRPGLSALTNALGVGLLGASSASDVALIGPAVSFIEYTGSNLTKVDAE